MKIVVIAAGLLISSVSIGAAQTATPGIDARQANQAARINQGVAQGQINPNEAARLARGQARVQRMESRAKADGVVTGRERARIHRAQDVQSRRIYRARHNPL